MATNSSPGDRVYNKRTQSKHAGLQVKQEEVQILAELGVKADEAAKTARQVASSVPLV